MRESDSTAPNASAHDHSSLALEFGPTDRNTSCNPQFLHNIQALTNHFEVPGLRPSMSKSEIMNHIVAYIYKKLNSSSQNQPSTSDGEVVIMTEFEELAQNLLSDPQSQNPTTDKDERYLMLRVNSLWSMIQKDEHENRVVVKNDTDSKADLKPNDSFSDLLMSLLRIASYPHFF